MKIFVCLMLSVAGTLLLFGCTNPSASNDTGKDFLDKSISEKLTVKELSDAIEIDSSFAERYEQVRSIYDSLSETQQATYYGITYKGWEEFLSQYGRYAEFYLMVKYPELKANDSIQRVADSIQTVKEGQAAAERRIDSVISSQVEAKRNLYNRNVKRK